MPFVYPQAIRNMDNNYSPTDAKHYYYSVYYHKKNARKTANKTRWIVAENAEYYIFRIADEANWLCNINNKLFSVVDKGKEIVGENGEHLAMFWKPTPVRAHLTF